MPAPLPLRDRAKEAEILLWRHVPPDRDALGRRLAVARVESRVEYAVPWLHPMLTDAEADRGTRAAGTG